MCSSWANCDFLYFDSMPPRIKMWPAATGVSWSFRSFHWLFQSCFSYSRHSSCNNVNVYAAWPSSFFAVHICRSLPLKYLDWGSWPPKKKSSLFRARLFAQSFSFTWLLSHGRNYSLNKLFFLLLIGAACFRKVSAARVYLIYLAILFRLEPWKCWCVVCSFVYANCSQIDRRWFTPNRKCIVCLQLHNLIL